MTKKTFWILVLIVFPLGAAVGAGIVFKACGPGPGYWIERAIYDRDVQIRQDRLDAAMDQLAKKEVERLEAQAATSAANERALELERRAAAGARAIAARDAQIESLRADAEAAIAANPAIRALIDAYELGRREDRAQIFTLKQQIAELGSPIENGTDPVTGRKLWLYPPGTTTGGLYAEILATRDEREIWKTQYTDEHMLRLSGDALRLGLERSVYSGKFWKAVGKGALLVGGIYGGFKAGKAIGHLLKIL